MAPKPPSQDEDFFKTQRDAVRILDEVTPRRYDPAVENIVREQQKVRDAIRGAWTGSDPYAEEQQRREMGIHVRRNSSGDIWAEPFSRPGRRGPVKVPEGKAYTIQQDDPDFWRDTLDWLTGEQTIFDIHTHPGDPRRFKSGPDGADLKATAGKSGLPGVIKAHDGLHYYGPNMPDMPRPLWRRFLEWK